MIVLHGLFGSATNWRRIARSLSARFDVHALDLRNHGRSPWADDMSYAAMAADVARFIERHGLAPAHVVGHSMGGKTAMVLALEQAPLVARLVVVDIAPVAYPHSHEGLVDALRGIDLERVSRRADADRALAAAVSEPGLRAFLLQNLVQRGERFEWRINLDAIAAGMTSLTGFPATGRRFEGPALFLHGEASGYVRPRFVPAIEALFPDVSLQGIANAGHWVHAEQPAAVTAAIEAFLS